MNDIVNNTSNNINNDNVSNINSSNDKEDKGEDDDVFLLDVGYHEPGVQKSWNSLFGETPIPQLLWRTEGDCGNGVGYAG